MRTMNQQLATSFRCARRTLHWFIELIRASLGNQRGGAEKPLGWISDEQGIPCITGERKTNAPAFLTQRIGVMAIQAAAEAAANAETTSIVSNAGSVANSVTGDTGRFVLGKTLSGGSDEISKWLLERQSLYNGPLGGLCRSPRDDKL
jgi:integrating conjugative element protein (TIGR03752 family)